MNVLYTQILIHCSSISFLVHIYKYLRNNFLSIKFTDLAVLQLLIYIHD